MAFAHQVIQQLGRKWYLCFSMVSYTEIYYHILQLSHTTKSKDLAPYSGQQFSLYVEVTIGYTTVTSNNCASLLITVKCLCSKVASKSTGVYDICLGALARILVVTYQLLRGIAEIILEMHLPHKYNNGTSSNVQNFLLCLIWREKTMPYFCFYVFTKLNFFGFK